MDTGLPHMKIPKVAISYRWIMVRHSIFAIGILGMLTGCAAVVQDVPAPRGSYFEREPEPATIKGAILTIIAGAIRSAGRKRTPTTWFGASCMDRIVNCPRILSPAITSGRHHPTKL
jgi:hypothetical protein